jgi:hypothetical protein
MEISAQELRALDTAITFLAMHHAKETSEQLISLYSKLVKAPYTVVKLEEDFKNEN